VVERQKLRGREMYGVFPLLGPPPQGGEERESRGADMGSIAKPERNWPISVCSSWRLAECPFFSLVVGLVVSDARGLSIRTWRTMLPENSPFPCSIKGRTEEASALTREGSKWKLQNVEVRTTARDSRQRSLHDERRDGGRRSWCGRGRTACLPCGAWHRQRRRVRRGETGDRGRAERAGLPSPVSGLFPAQRLSGESVGGSFATLGTGLLSNPQEGYPHQF
jgi:hypothetical protein